MVIMVFRNDIGPPHYPLAEGHSDLSQGGY